MFVVIKALKLLPANELRATMGFRPTSVQNKYPLHGCTTIALGESLKARTKRMFVLGL
jgi:hypothetical protein